MKALAISIFNNRTTNQIQNKYICIFPDNLVDNLAS